MPGIVRLGDVCSGHSCWPSRPNNQASSNVFVNSLGCHRVGDSWAMHCCPSIPECHSSTAATGSSTVFANGKSVCRAGDSVACGSTMVGCSGNVFAG
jgi:uncharacterized Zn-binding protein involved in type VI secretion